MHSFGVLLRGVIVLYSLLLKFVEKCKLWLSFLLQVSTNSRKPQHRKFFHERFRDLNFQGVLLSILHNSPVNFEHDPTRN